MDALATSPNLLLIVTLEYLEDPDFVEFFFWRFIFFLADHSSVFCSSLLHLRILFPCRQEKNAFLIFFLSNIMHITFCVSCRGVIFLWQVMLWIDDAAFSSNYCSYLLYIFLQVGKTKVTTKLGFKILRNHCQNTAIIMTNRIRKVRQGVDFFDKIILDSCKLYLGQNFRMSTTIFSTQPAEYKPVVHGAQPIRANSLKARIKISNRFWTGFWRALFQIWFAGVNLKLVARSKDQIWFSSDPSIFWDQVQSKIGHEND